MAVRRGSRNAVEAEQRTLRKELRRQESMAALSWVLSEAKGRRFMWDFLARSNVFAVTFTGEALTGAFNEGRRNLGLLYVDLIMAEFPQQWTQMQAEAMERQAREGFEDEKDREEAEASYDPLDDDAGA